MKNISFKVKDHELERVKHYMATPEGGNTSISLFVRDAMKNQCDNVAHLRAGGLMLTYPNPDNFKLSWTEKRDALVILKQADTDLTKLNGYFGGYLSGLVAYLQDHFFEMEDADREAIGNRFVEDLGAEARCDSMEDAEDEATEKRLKALFQD